MKIKNSLKSEKAQVNIAIAILVIIIVATLTVYFVATYYSNGKKIELGDCADVHYVGKFATNGTIFETTYDDSLNKTGGTPKKIFVNPNWDLSLSFEYQGYSSAMPYGFLNGLVGVKEGETKNLTVLPEDAYGDWNLTALNEYYEFIFGTTYYPREIGYDAVEVIS